MRAYSICWGLVILLVIFYLLRQLFPDRRVAQLASLLMAVDFMILWTTADGRMEAPACALALYSFAAYLFLRDSGTPFYHRGYPRGERWKEKEAFTCAAPRRRRVAVNAGLWLDDPDIDAMTRLERPIVVRGMRAGAPDRFVLQPGTWSPFNSQNTALLRKVIPAYFVSPCVGRYDDIWPSYLVTRIANHLGDVIAYGQPLLRQKRNEHNLWKDLDNERVGSLLTDEFCATLRSIPLEGATYHQCYGELVTKLRDAWKPGATWNDAMIQAREGLLEGMAIWHAVFSSAGSTAEKAEDPLTNDLHNLALI